MSEPPTGKAPTRRRLFAAAAALLLLAVTFALTEVLVRALLPYNTPDTVRAGSLQYLPSIFARHRLRPNQHVAIDSAWGRKPQAQRTERVYTISASGYRGQAVVVPKPPGVTRVVVVGGSSVFDQYATEGEDWPALVEIALHEKGYRQAEVLNAGVPGQASFDSLGRLYSEIWMFEPDYVLLYNAWNDLKYIDRIGPRAPLISLFAPWDATSDPFQNYRNALDRWLAVSQVYVKLRNRYYLDELPPGAEGRITPRPDPPAGDRRLGLRQYRLNVELFVDAARNIGAIPILLTQATLVAPDNDEESRQRISYQYQSLDHADLVAAFDECHRVIRAVAQNKARSSSIWQPRTADARSSSSITCTPARRGAEPSRIKWLPSWWVNSTARPQPNEPPTRSHNAPPHPPAGSSPCPSSPLCTSPTSTRLSPSHR